MRVKDGPPVPGRVTTGLRLVSFNTRQQNEEAFFQKHSWRAHVSPMFPGKHCFQCQFCFQDANYAYATRQGISTKIRACESTCKNFASTSNSIACENSRPSSLPTTRAGSEERRQFPQASNSSNGQICEHFQIGWDHSIPLQFSAALLAVVCTWFHQDISYKQDIFNGNVSYSWICLDSQCGVLAADCTGHDVYNWINTARAATWSHFDLNTFYMAFILYRFPWSVFKAFQK